MSARARLTILFSSTLTAAMTVVLVTVYGFMRYVPTYALNAAPAASPRAIGKAGPTAAGPAVITATPALTITSSDQVVHTLLAVCAVALGVLVVCGTLLGWVIAGRALRPIAAINRAVSAAGAGSLNHRIGATGPRDEFGELSRNVDDMLASLQSEFEARERFVANAAHELKTPLATVKTLIDVTLARPGLTVDQSVEALRSVRLTNERNIRTVSALLDLATAAHPRGRERVNLADLAGAVLEDPASEPILATTRWRPELEEAWTTGDPELLRRVVLNLVDNAARYNTSDGWVRVTTGRAGDHARLAVENTGPEVSAAARLADPFVRGVGRTGPSGHGLGLAVVASIVRAHGGSLSVQPRDGGGLDVSVLLPLSSGVEPAAVALSPIRRSMR
ncbi:HAMP domain-containing sensor histidine kinase [Leifsonia sp. NPDC077715]|uniref:HAMP domain-containing sensor histidine kinase n=1 Tax=Leifsonia sp. NPDC077715 TaxID=3155539 RepID=UPI00342B3A12